MYKSGKQMIYHRGKEKLCCTYKNKGRRICKWIEANAQEEEIYVILHVKAGGRRFYSSGDHRLHIIQSDPSGYIYQ